MIPRSPLLSRPGAVENEGTDAGVAWHYGDPVKEQRLLADGVGFVDLSHRVVVRVEGPDRLTWLHSLTTQQITGLAPRASVEALILSPKGHVEHDLHLVDDGEATWVTTEPGTGPVLLEHLIKMRFMLRVEPVDVTDDWAVLGEPVGRESADGEPLAWVDPWPRTATGGVRYSPVDDLAHPAAQRPWREVLVPRADLVAHVDEWPIGGTWASEALRIAAWRPRFGFETDHRTIPHEVDWLRTAVHMAKGCYRGQETVARVHNLGKPPRRLVMLHLDGSGHHLPERGSDVFAGDRRVGHLTSTARHHELGPIALALLKRSTPADAVLVTDGVSAAQELVVGV